MQEGDLNAFDFAVIEQALREAMNRGTDYQDTLQFRNVLTKLQRYSSTHSTSMTTESSEHHAIDGFRYDYDDNKTV